LSNRKEIEDEDYGDEYEDQDAGRDIGGERQGRSRIRCLAQKLRWVLKSENMGDGDKLRGDENNPTEPKRSK
jgi:hypothetical protein